MRRAKPAVASSSVASEAGGDDESDFVASAIFSGQREGYVFKAGPRGRGYYRRCPNSMSPAASSSTSLHAQAALLVAAAVLGVMLLIVSLGRGREALIDIPPEPRVGKPVGSS